MFAKHPKMAKRWAKETPKGANLPEHVKTAAFFDELGKIAGSSGYVGPIQKQTEDNANFRKVIFTGKHAQLVLMSIDDEIGEETHEAVDQFFRIDGGQGVVIMNGVRHPVKDGDAFLVPAGTKHNVISTGTEPLKLYSVYSPPNHQPGTIHKTRADAMQAEQQGTDPKPSPASIVPGTEKTAEDEEGSPQSPKSTDEPTESKEEKKEEEEEEANPNKKVPKEVLLDFFRKNPHPVDDQIHELAEAHGASPHTMETQIYGILGDQLKGK